MTVEPSGAALLVHETIVYDFGTLPERHGIYRDLIARVDYPDKPGYDRVYPLTILSVHGSAGTPDQYTEEEYTSGDVTYARIKIGDPDQTITGVHTYDITYACAGCSTGLPTTTSWCGTSTASTGRCSSSPTPVDRARAGGDHRRRAARPAASGPRSRARRPRRTATPRSFTAQAARALLEPDVHRRVAERARWRPRRSPSCRSASTSRRRSGSRRTRVASPSACSSCSSALRSLLVWFVGRDRRARRLGGRRRVRQRATCPTSGSRSRARRDAGRVRAARRPAARADRHARRLQGHPPRRDRDARRPRGARVPHDRGGPARGTRSAVHDWTTHAPRQARHRPVEVRAGPPRPGCSPTATR